MPLSPGERAQVERYGAADLKDSPSLTPQQRRELEEEAEEEDAAEEEDEVDQIPANQAMRRLRGATDENALPAWLGKTLQEDAMTLDYCDAEMLDAADDVLAQLDAVQEVPALRKAIQALASDSVLQGVSARRLHAEIGAVQKSLRTAYHSERSNRHAIASLATVVDRLCKGLMRLGQEKPSPLAKACREVLVQALDREPTAAEMRHVLPPLRKALGPRGGTAFAWSKERESTMRLTEALTKSQIDIWRCTNRVPDGVNPAQPRRTPAAAQERDRQLQIAHALASMNISPMALQHLARR
jgi:hypothetical protein